MFLKENYSAQALRDAVRDVADEIIADFTSELDAAYDGLSKKIERLAMELACLKPPSMSSSQNGMEVDVYDVRNRLDQAILSLVNGSNTDPEREGLIHDVERLAMELDSLSKQEPADAGDTDSTVLK